MSRKKNIALTGFMGAGKSTVGMNIARLSGYGFIETDAEIEKRLKKTIADIFAQYGEDYFRKLESSVCEEAGNKEGVVISTGGGVVKRPENGVYLKQNGIIVYLKASPIQLYNNLKDCASGRPLLRGLAGQEMLTAIESMLDQRRESYEAFADVVINVDGKSIDDISNETLLIIGGNK